MPWIRVIEEDEAEGLLRDEYEAARRRAGRVWQIIKIMSRQPAVLKSSLSLYGLVMHGRSPLSRAQREMLAVIVSKVNDCHY
ncbi:MAG: hypothetical protein RL885_26980 [Planctomycetota bacterium]